MYERHEPEREAGAPAPERTGLSPALILFAVVAVIAVVFVIQNGDRTDVDFLFWSFNARVWFAILVAIGIGVLLDRLLITWWRRGRRRRAET